MIPRDCKRLAEVDFPVAEVSRHAAREKSIRHGHPSTLHLWWARRPLAACRAVLMALLLPDPCDPHCPAEFKQAARKLLRPVPNTGRATSNVELRKGLLRFIADFANWDNAANPTYLECARGLVKAAHGEEPPLVVDPFAGGGSIPLEALRVGCDAFASDLNPVACLILKVMLEDIPRHGPALAEELRRVGKQIKEQAEKELAEFYPVDPDGSRPIAYLWARTVRCEAVGCGAEIPLMRSFWLCKKANRRRALRLVPVAPVSSPAKRHGAGDSAATEDDLNALVSPKGNLRFEIYEPKSEAEVRGGTVNRGNAVCPCCHTVLAVARVRAQLSAQRGGADVIFEERKSGTGLRPVRVGGARLLAVVTLKPGEQGRHYRLPTERDYEAVRNAQARLKSILDEWERCGKQGLCPVPDEPTPAGGGSGAGRAFSVQKYGMLQWGDLFTARQKVAMRTLGLAAHDRPQSGNDAIRDAMAMVIGRSADYASSGVVWAQEGEFVAHTFGRQALPIVWDFAEAVPWTDSSGNLDGAIDWTARVIEAWPGSRAGQVQQADATEHPLPDETAHVWFTDPPYYDAVPYADLSDFFLVWLKRALPGHPLLRDPFDPANPLTPKTREAVQNERSETEDGSPKDKAFYEEQMAKAFAEGRRALREDGVGSVVFAHKTTEGWEALLNGMIRGGWTITGSWPIATERPGRLRSQESAALATSVHLVCRPRPEDAGIGSWEEVLHALPGRIGNWMERLSGEGIRGADLVFSCIGPALELFSKYDEVETAEGREVKLDKFLEKVWEVVGRTALQQILGTAEARARNSAAGALEEDARLTALFLWTLQSTDGNSKIENRHSEEGEEEAEDEEEEEAKGRAKKGYMLIYDVVRRFAQPLGIHLQMWEGRIIETKKGVVRLIPVLERAEQLFGEAGTEAAALAIERSGGREPQYALFPESPSPSRPSPSGRGKRRERGRSAGLQAGTPGAGKMPALQATTLDRVHMAMLLQAGGQATALRAMLEAEIQRSPDFLRLANALSALYRRADPKGEETRLLEAMLLAVPR
jgi:adenine-specific DNA methylase